MYVERETGGFARGRTIDGDAEQVRGIEKPSADSGPAADQKQLQKQFDEPAAQPARAGKDLGEMNFVVPAAEAAGMLGVDVDGDYVDQRRLD